MARTTESEVKSICGTSLTDEQITPFLCTANSMITNILAGLEYGDDELEQFELWLAAHLVSVLDPSVSREKIGETDTVYDGKTDMGLKFTRFGQQLMVMEYKGKFSSLQNSRGSASLEVLG